MRRQGRCPPGVQLKPQEQATLAYLRLQLGDRAGAKQLISRLTAIGYRHPDLVRIPSEAAPHEYYFVMVEAEGKR